MFYSDKLETLGVGERSVLEGTVEVNPYGNWSDVEHGTYVNGERVGDEFSPLSSLEGKRVRITIEVLPPEESPDE